MNKNHTIILAILGLFCLLLGNCQGNNLVSEAITPISPTVTIAESTRALLVPTETPVATRIATETPAEVFPQVDERQTPKASPVAPVTSTPTQTISDEGPWFVYFEEENNSLIAVNSDASGAKVFLSDLSPLSYPDIAGSSENYLAIITEWSELSDEYLSKLALLIVELPGGEIKDLIPLITHPDIPNDEQYLSALLYSSSASLSWSPNGRYLAFVAAIDGPSGDLYVYDTLTGEYKRLSYGPNLASDPKWSPNGEWILHSENNNLPEMCYMIAVWAASLETNEVNHLFDENCGYAILEWTSPESFISLSLQNAYYKEIKSVSVNGFSNSLIPFTAYILDHKSISVNPNTGTVAFVAIKDTGADPIYGIFFTSPADPNAYKTLEIEDDQLLFQLKWIPGLNSYIAYPDFEKCGVALISETSAVTCLLDEDFAYTSPQTNKNSQLKLTGMTISPDGETLLIGSVDGLFFVDGLSFYTETLQPVELQTENGEKVETKYIDPIWNLDSSRLVLRTNRSIYYVDISAQKVHLLYMSDHKFDYVTWSGTSKNLFFEFGGYLYFYDWDQAKRIYLDDNVSRFSYTWVGN